MQALIALAVILAAIPVIGWLSFALLLFVDEEIGVKRLREIARVSLFRTCFLWPRLVGFRALLLPIYPLLYLFRVQVVGCMVRKPMKPSPALGGKCADANIETLLAQHEGAYTTR